MNTEAMKKNFEKIAATEYTNPVDNVLSFGTYKEGEYDYAGVQSSWVCYQQAVKDMEVNIQPILTAISMLERDCKASRDEIAGELRTIVGKIKEVDHE